jgi:orotidine-5'-phosphate decarboxylase
MSFATRLKALTASGPALCVGIDPHPALLESWGFGDGTEGLKGWSQLVGELVKLSGIHVAKPQVALFERAGLSGMSTLSALIGALRQAGVLVIGDAKRGDIGSTMEGYADAWLRAGSDFEVDALTVVPYQGLGALEPAFERADAHDKGVFVLAATSNPEARVTQSALRHDGHTVAGGVVHDLHHWVTTNGAMPESYGVVLGATIDPGALGVELGSYPTMPILAPGYGAQGATLTSARTDFAGSRHVLPVAARSLLQTGPEGFVQAIEGALAEVASA